MKVREFLRVNKLKQVDIARYLGVTEAAISNVVKGKSDFSKDNLIKILENPYEWDTSMLKDSPQPKLVADQIPSLSNTEILLRDLLAERDNEIRALQEIIWDLKEEIGRLKGELASAHKGGNARSVDSSSSAVAV